MTLGHDKISFLTLPTPLTRLNNISKDLGVNFYLKRDDLTDFGVGGNKLRKLEYFVKDALDHDATVLLTVGGAQTNHGRLTAAVAAKYGMKSAIIAVDDYPGELSSNLLLDGIMGCDVYLVKPTAGKIRSQLEEEAIAKVTAQYEANGERVYFIPLGGSNQLGALGYYDCALELAAQFEKLKINSPHIFVTVGSMGTYTGLLTGIHHKRLDMKLTGIGVLPYTEPIAYHGLKHFQRIKDCYNLDFSLKESDLDLTSNYDFGAYNNPVKEVREAIYYMGSREGIILDPCYTGKTFAAILHMASEGLLSCDENIVMIHTGGMPGIYTYHHRIEMEKELLCHINII